MLGTTLATRGGGEPVSIISPGVLNTDAGPDFSNARLRIGNTEWCGNVEIHVKASDWYHHRHDQDPAYDSVILHVVAVDDRKVCRSDGSSIPQVLVSFPESFYRIYSSLADNIGGVRCQHLLPSLLESDPLSVSAWLETLAVERMQAKASRILDELRNGAGDWERTCFVTFARGLGFGLNSEPFEILARSIPLKCLARHSNDSLQLEALLFGQAGMLDTSVHIFDEYYQLLCREYFFLARKYGLRPMNAGLWKYARTRPGNFPHRRIALLAKAVEGGFSMMSDIIAAGADIERLRSIFDLRPEGYWRNHTGFDMEAGTPGGGLSPASTDLLLINVASPLLYAHGATYGDADAAETGLDIWCLLKSENNIKTRQWSSAGIGCENAMRSQGLLQLSKEYCDKGRCLDCRIGHSLLRKSANVSFK